MSVYFNPHPTSWLSASGTLSLVWTTGVVVSILIEPLGWARVAVTIAPLCFNPHPTFRLGVTQTFRSFPTPIISFNPHPTSRLGAAILWSLECVPGSFNPHPTSRSGADGGAVSSSLFQSSPNLSVGCEQGVNLHVIIGKNRDAPDRKPGEYDLIR